MSQQPYYESMYILSPGHREEEVEGHVKTSNLGDLVTEAAPEVLRTHNRVASARLANHIAKHREGILRQLNHSGGMPAGGALESAMRLSEMIFDISPQSTGTAPCPAPQACRRRKRSTRSLS